MTKLWIFTKVKMIIKNFFFDRDGIINIDTSYPYQSSEIKFIEDTINLLKYLTKKKRNIFIVTNQSGINRGFYTIKDFLLLNTFFENYFKFKSINITKTYYCPHLPNQNCICRKPKNGLILKALKEFNLKSFNSTMIGDKIIDVEAGINSGFKKNFLISSKKRINVKNPKVLVLKSVKEIKDYL